MKPTLTPREPGLDGMRQGEPELIHYRPILPADKSLLELRDAQYTWRLTLRQVEEVEAFILAFDPARDAIPLPPLPLEDRLRLARGTRAADQRKRLSDVPDYPISAEMRQAVADYRQALRDLPTHAAWPDIVDWPAMPELNLPIPYRKTSNKPLTGA